MRSNSDENDTTIEPNTYSRGSRRIDFILCSRVLLTFISSAGILPFGTIAFSDHRGVFIDINFRQFLRNLNTDLVTNSPCTLISSHSKRVLQYKKALKIYLKYRKIQTKIEQLNKLMEDKQLTEDNMIDITNIDKTVSIGMLVSENILIKIMNNSSWSLELNRIIQHATYWSLVKSQFKTKISQHKRLLDIQSKLPL